ncbi:MAG: response regulator [Gemmatimonadota bacterium]
MSEGAARILVVEDEEAVRNLIVAVLSRAGYTPVPTADAARALDVLDRDEIDLVLLDLHMPGPADGEDLLFLLRDRGDEVPIIIVSGFVDDDTADRHPDCVHAVIKKPIRIESFLDTIAEVLSLA